LLQHSQDGPHPPIARFAQLLDVDRSHPVTSTLRLVIFGGEPLNSRMLLPWFDRHPEFECRMVNMFGITETTVHVTLETVTREHALASSKSVGHALPGWYYYVMNSDGRLLPPGATGEIFVGGAGVAQSYLNRPELTAQRFVPDPFTGERIYRSGDKGRLRLDGRLERQPRQRSTHQPSLRRRAYPSSEPLADGPRHLLTR